SECTRLSNPLSEGEFIMTLFQPAHLPRRRFLQSVGGALATACCATLKSADDLPKNTNPHAIAGDPVEPDWTQSITVTVGPKDADLIGATDRVLQAAVYYVSRFRGGTVLILLRSYRLRNSIFLRSKIRL